MCERPATTTRCGSFPKPVVVRDITGRFPLTGNGFPNNKEELGRGWKLGSEISVTSPKPAVVRGCSGHPGRSTAPDCLSPGGFYSWTDDEES